jgi:hypothetical protein
MMVIGTGGIGMGVMLVSVTERTLRNRGAARRDITRHLPEI